MPTILTLTPAHWPAVRAIYADGIATRNATFETEVPDWATWDAGKLPGHRFVAADGDRVLGWAAVAPTSSRPAYAGVVENSVYLAEAARGKGLGRLLMETLIDSTERAGIWTVQTGIFPENVASLALHRAVGFREVGIRERVGRVDGRWRDVVFLERRSRVV
jgi:phosphinothricin acetyltransferase